jgi:hypothetical protein
VPHTSEAEPAPLGAPGSASTSPAASTADAAATSGGSWPRRVVTSGVGAGLLLLAIYVALSFLNSPQGFLGTDTGGKVATLKVMGERGDFDPDVGYWAEQWDPTGRVHGLYYTAKIGSRFINVTSLPLVLAGEPLWRLGGYRLALLLPMAGAVAAAYAARALARRMGGGTGWAAFWLVGLASPLLIYALDFWEHTLGVALMAWGVIALYDAVERRPTWWRGLAAGVAFGVAFSMRTEAGVYAFTSVAIACLAVLVWRRDLVGALVTGATASAGFVALFLANSALETAVLGQTLRSGRTSGAASAAGSDSLLRIKEALVTGLSPFPSLDGGTMLLAVVLAVALGYLIWATAHRRRGPLVTGAWVAVVALYVIRLAGGLGFVPGLVATTPIAMVGVVLGWRDRPTRLVTLMALVPLPLVFLFQFSGGAAPQWAGRYILTSGFLLLVVGVCCWDRIDERLRVTLITLSVAVAVFGVAWLSVRSHQVATAADRLNRLPVPVLISPNGFIPREFGATYGQKDWLSSGSAADERFAVDVVARSGRSSFALVDLDTTDPAPKFSGFHRVRSQTMPFLSGADFKVTTYERNR